MRDRPDYLPAAWIILPGWRWAAAKPERVLAWFCVAIVVMFGLFVIAVASGSTVLLICVLIASIRPAIEVTIYVPRAWRAVRDATQNPN
jgi:hypothetical protein